jgi:hypothetical protein
MLVRSLAILTLLMCGYMRVQAADETIAPVANHVTEEQEAEKEAEQVLGCDRCGKKHVVLACCS